MTSTAMAGKTSCAPGALEPGHQPADVQLVLSGRDGSTIREHLISSVAHDYDAAARVGGVNGDGVADYARTRKQYIARRPNVVEVRSGVDDALLRSLSGPAVDVFGGARMRGENASMDRG